MTTTESVHDSSADGVDPQQDMSLVDEYDDVDDDFVPEPPHRFGKVTLVLAAAMLIASGVFAGVLLQKHEGTSAPSARAGAGGAVPGGVFAGFGGEGFPGGTGRRVNGGTGTDGGVGSAAGTLQGGAATGAPAVIGTITAITGTDLSVENLGGKTLTVHTSDTTTITTTGLNHPLKSGDRVVVVGTTASDGSVTATSVVAR